MKKYYFLLRLIFAWHPVYIYYNIVFFRFHFFIIINNIRSNNWECSPRKYITTQSCNETFIKAISLNFWFLGFVRSVNEHWNFFHPSRLLSSLTRLIRFSRSIQCLLSRRMYIKSEKYSLFSFINISLVFQSSFCIEYFETDEDFSRVIVVIVVYHAF